VRPATRSDFSFFFLVIIVSTVNVCLYCTQVVLVVDDVNDEAPVFTQSSYELSLAEHLPVGGVVGHVTATDRDAPPFDRFVYKIVDTYDTGADEKFSIDPRSGRIISTVSFDREQTDE